jgi:hypothetical protein
MQEDWYLVLSGDGSGSVKTQCHGRECRESRWIARRDNENVDAALSEAEQVGRGTVHGGDQVTDKAEFWGGFKTLELDVVNEVAEVEENKP